MFVNTMYSLQRVTGKGARAGRAAATAAPYYDPDTYKFDERNFRFGILVLYRISMILASLHCRCSGLTLRCRSCPGGCSIPGSWSPPPRPRSSTARCELCAPGHMPTEGGSFVSCREFCHGHTDTCVQEGEGYTCVDCGNGTTGARCDTCAAGHWRGSRSLLLPCKQCDCNGHGDTCDPDTGRDCACRNNTATEAGSSSSTRAGECATCEQYFIGDPRGGHSCYRAMMVNTDYCLDQVIGAQLTSVIIQMIMTFMTRTSTVEFFAVLPKFMNVHIRVSVDMVEGEVDVILTSNRQMFLMMYYLRIKNASAEDRATFVTLGGQEVLLVQRVRSRLVVSIPDTGHDLLTRSCI